MSKAIASQGSARLRMIQAAQELFHRQGIHATSIDQILRRSGTGKSQFAHYFKNKDGLVHAVLQHLHAWLGGDDAPVNCRFETWADLETWFGFFVRAQRRFGCDRACPVGTIGNDLSEHQEALRQDVCLIYEWTREQLSIFFAARSAQGELDVGLDPRALADFCMVTVQGGLLLGKIQRDSTSFQNAVDHALSYLESLKRNVPSNTPTPRDPAPT